LNNQRTHAFNENNAKPLTLLQLLSYLSEPQKRLKLISEILHECKNLKGGQLASTLHRQVYDGKAASRGLVSTFLKATCRPLQTMLGCWLIDGEIKDPHKEFFVEEINEVSSDRLWHHKYRIVLSRVPSFISKILAHRILVSGKSINFLREVCEDKTPIKGREELRTAFDNNIDGLFKFGNDTKLHELIDQVYFNTSQKVLEIAMGPYRLMEHLFSMRKYLLLGQGDFITLLMENLKDELDRPAKDLYQHALFSIVASSIRATSQIDESEVLKHLDVKLVHAIDGDKGWDIFTLQYTVHGPLATILEPNMGKYQELFKPLWKAKHVEFVLSNIWKEQMLNSKILRSLKDTLDIVTYRLHLYTSEMIHFVNQVSKAIIPELKVDFKNYILSDAVLHTFRSD
jgi:gamma-tubulin complex component 3